jgi:hypothetical protein
MSRSSRYKWVKHEGVRLYDVGILADGSLHNPNGYPAERLSGRCCPNRRYGRRRTPSSAPQSGGSQGDENPPGPARPQNLRPRPAAYAQR